MISNKLKIIYIFLFLFLNINCEQNINKLISDLSSNDYFVCEKAVLALSNMGEEAKDAVPHLIAATINNSLHENIKQALYKIVPNKKDLLPHLTKAIRKIPKFTSMGNFGGVEMFLMNILGEMGPLANPLRPYVIKKLGGFCPILEKIGPPNKNHASLLGKMVVTEENPYHILQELQKLGTDAEEAVPYILKSLHDEKKSFFILMTLDKIAPNIEKAIPDLLNRLKNHEIEPFFWSTIAEVLQKSKGLNKILLPLIEILKNIPEGENANHKRARIILMFGAMGKNAISTVPLLRKFFKSGSWLIKFTCISSLSKIDRPSLLKIDNWMNIGIEERTGNDILIEAVNTHDIDLVKFLIKMGATQNTRSNHGLTALNKASLDKNKEIVDILTKAKAKIKLSDKKIFSYAEEINLRSLDPINADKSTEKIICSIYDTLFEYKYIQRKPHEIKLGIASKMPRVSADGLIYTIHLQQGVFFQNHPIFNEKNNSSEKGREVIAEDFVYSLKRHFDPKNKSYWAWLWENRIVGLDDWRLQQKKQNATNYNSIIEGLHAIDKYTIQIKLVEPYPEIIYTFASAFSAIVPREAVTTYNNLEQQPVGSGPFCLKEKHDKKVILERNPNYRKEIFDIYAEGYVDGVHQKVIENLHGKKIPLVDKIICHDINSKNVMLHSLINNEIHLTHVPIYDVEKSGIDIKTKCNLVPKKEKMVVLSVFKMSNATIGYSQDKKRNEMNKALRKVIRDTCRTSSKKNCSFEILPNYISGYSKISNSKFKKTIVTELLQGLGWESKKLPILKYFVLRADHSIIHESLLKMRYPYNKQQKKIFKNSREMFIAEEKAQNPIYQYRWILDYPDAENLLQLFYGLNINNDINKSHFNNSEYNTLFKKIKYTKLNSPKRIAIFHRLLQILEEEAVVISEIKEENTYLLSKKLLAYPTDNFITSYFKYVDIKD